MVPVTAHGLSCCAVKVFDQLGHNIVRLLRSVPRKPHSHVETDLSRFKIAHGFGKPTGELSVWSEENRQVMPPLGDEGARCPRFGKMVAVPVIANRFTDLLPTLHHVIELGSVGMVRPVHRMCPVVGDRRNIGDQCGMDRFTHGRAGVVDVDQCRKLDLRIFLAHARGDAIEKDQ